MDEISPEPIKSPEPKAENKNARKLQVKASVYAISIIIAFVLIIVNATNPAGPVSVENSQIIKSKAYAAREVLIEAKTNLATGKSEGATFLSHRSSHKDGPAYERCNGSPQSALGDFEQLELAFKDTTHQAWLITATTDKLWRTEYYGENLSGDAADFKGIFSDPEWNLTLKTYLDVAHMVDENGVILADNALLTSQVIDGIEYIDIDFAFENSNNPKEQFCYEGENALVKLKIRADSKKIVSYRLYLDKFQDENLVYEDSHNFEYATGPFSDFEPQFLAAGFDKQKGAENVAKLGQLMDPNAPRIGR